MNQAPLFLPVTLSLSAALTLTALLLGACVTSRGGGGGGGAPPAGSFACGDYHCLAATQLCYSFYGHTDEPGVCATEYGCWSIPEECLASPTCACITEAQENEGTYGYCSGDPSKEFSVSDGDCG